MDVLRAINGIPYSMLCITVQCTQQGLYISVIAITGGRTVKNEDPDQPDIMLNLGSVLMFATGMDHQPPMGFPNEPQIMFDDRGGWTR